MELWQLKQRQSLPLEAKVIMTQLRIRQWYDYWKGQVYVSFSGGKDSTVLLHIARGLFPGIPAVFCDTGLEYPEIKEFVKTWDNVEWIRPKMSFKQVIEQYGYPVVSKEQAKYIREARTTKSEKLLSKRMSGKVLDNGTIQGAISKKWLHLLDAPFQVSEKCCHVMKKKPFAVYERSTNKTPLIGMMADEGVHRREAILLHGCNSFNNTKRAQSRPLAFWTEQDVYQYILQHNLPIASIYGDVIPTDFFGHNYKTTGVRRTGCMFCMFGVHLEKYPNRFQRMKKTHPKLWEYCMDTLGIRRVLEYINVPCE